MAFGTIASLLIGGLAGFGASKILGQKQQKAPAPEPLPTPPTPEAAGDTASKDALEKRRRRTQTILTNRTSLSPLETEKKELLGAA